MRPPQAVAFFRKASRPSSRAPGVIQGVEDPSSPVEVLYHVPHIQGLTPRKCCGLQIEALRLKREPKDPSVACLEQEDGEGNVEYKYRIKDPHPVRLQQLVRVHHGGPGRLPALRLRLRI